MYNRLSVEVALGSKPMVGKTILHYRILKEIGKGGMGVVYKAEDSKLHRTVAIKALAADLVGDEKARARFLREARAASSIDHPNICTVYEVNEAENVLFFVMQYIDGKTLKKFIGGRPLPLDQGLEFSLEIADALAEAHRRNVIHRDIKSSNIMLNERNQLKILDFGLAKLIKAASDSSESAQTLELTAVGSPFGTASYMSPEQARGEAADARSDIFSLGVVMYEMFTGQLPFKGRTSVDVMHAVMHDEPTPLGDSAPGRLQQIIAKALSKNATGRYQSTEVLLEDLRALVRSHYAQTGVVPADKSASFRASKQPPKPGKLLDRISNWAQRTFSGAPASPAREESSSAGTSATPDITPSMWQSRDKKTIAILPFRNLSGASENDFYGFSLADSVITELAQLHDLVVRPSSYVAQYQNKDVDPRAIGTQLAVDAVLIGGYLKSGDRFRLTPQLVDTASGEIVWTEKIDVESKDIITVQDTISRQIVDGLRVKTSTKEQERLVKTPTESAEAYECYLKARTSLYKFITQTLDVVDLESAVDLFTEAVQRDPNFALAHSGLGVCEVNYVLKGMGGLEHYHKAKECFDRAIDLDKNLVEPRVRMIYIDLIAGRSEGARQQIRRLMRRAPNEPSVHAVAAYVYRVSGQYERALEAWDRVLKISPTDVVYASSNRVRIFIYQHDYDRAERELARGLAFEPNHPLLRAYAAVVDYYRGQIEKATMALEDILAKNPELHSQKVFLAYCYLARGDRERAFELIDRRVMEIARADQDIAYRLATAYALAGRTDEAFEWLECSISMGNENYPWVTGNPNWEGLRDDPRFKDILEDLKARWEKLSEPGEKD
ncbi:MAG: protein kinase [Blastocatellia bacterium]